MVVKCKLFGIPEVFKDGKKIAFPFKKAEALFYYLIVKKKSFRDTLVDLFWGSVDEETAKKSLRNAVYIINKTFSEGILVSPQRSIIMLNPQVEFDTDLDIFLKDDECSAIEAYSGEFLEGFFVKDADDFEKWVFTIRNHYKDTYVNKLQKQIQKCIKEKKLYEVEAFCKNLISTDEFNEKAYRILMNIYRKMGQYDRSIDVYNNLSKLLRTELSVTPDLKTNELLAEIIKEKAARQAISRNVFEEYFYGRQNEIERLNSNFYKFSNGENAKSIIILGEAGLGKSTLITRHLKYIEDGSIIIFKTNCYQVEENYLLKPWNDILYQLSKAIEKENIEIPTMLQKIVSHVFPSFSINNEVADENPIAQIDILKYQVAEKAIIDIFKKVAEKKKIVLVFEDIQWIDNMSLSLIQELMIENKNRSLIFIAASRIGHGGKTEKFIANMKAYDLIETIQLERFSREETFEFASGMMPELNINDELGDLIYKETEGNTFFIVEFLNNLKHNKEAQQITPKMQDILKSRLLNVSDEGKKILNIASLFFDKVTLEDLQAISEKDELELIDVLEELQDKYLLKETNEGSKIGFVFTHQKLREFVYSQLTISKRRILHIRIARYIESQLRNEKSDSILYSKLIYHFENGGNKHAALEYRIKNLVQYLQIHHEVFPVLEEEYLSESQYFYLNEEQIEKEINNIGRIIGELKHEEGSSPSLNNMELSFLHILGRSNIRRGDYDSGLNIIEELIDKSLTIQNYDMALKGYKQVIYYSINTYNLERMHENIEKALDIAYKLNFEEEICILLRLKGMHKVMEGEFDEGEKLLQESINRLERLKQKDRYTLNIAANYNYLGESKKNRRQFEGAILYYNKAISLCEQKGIVRGMTIFNTNAGQAAYDYGDYENARVYLNKAEEIYEKLNLLWRRSIAYGYLSLLLIKENKYEKALQYLIQSDKDAMMIKSPYERGLVLRVKAEIRRKMEKDKNLKKVFGSYLNEPAKKYCDEGIKLLEGIKGCYEIDILKKLKSI